MKIGLSLSGGGARGIAHIGILQAFDEAGIRPVMITGTSAGAIVGAFYCQGITPVRIFEIVQEVKLYKYLQPALTLSGLLRMEASKSIYEQYLQNDDFSSLKIPLVVAATNIRTGVTDFLQKGSIIDALMASSAVPVIFHPVKLDGEHYVDGGILNNLPVEPLINHADKIIGVNCNPIDENYRLGNFRSVIERSLLMTINVNARFKKELCDLFVEPPELKGYGAFDFKKAHQMYEIGYQHGRTLIDLIHT